MTARHAADIGTAMGLTALLILGLAGCSLPWKTASPWSHGAPATVGTSNRPSPPSSDPTSPPTPKATAPTTITVPTPSPGEVTRVVYRAGAQLESTTAVAPEAPQSYVVLSGCLPKKPGVSFTYSLTTAEAPYTTLASATMECSGSSQMDTVILPDADAVTVRLSLSGDLGDTEAAYAILTPEQYAQSAG